MHERQRIERKELEEKLKNSGMTEEEKKELRKLQQKEQQVEQEDVNYRLKLEQDEEAEKLRKVGDNTGTIRMSDNRGNCQKWHTIDFQ